MDEDLIGIGADGYTEYADGSWEQVFDNPDGTQYTIFGDVLGDVSANVIDDAGTVLQTIDPAEIRAAPDYSFNPGELVKIGTQLYRYFATNQNGRTVYKGVPLTAAQQAALRAQQSQKNQWLLPALAAGAFFLFK